MSQKRSAARDEHKRLSGRDASMSGLDATTPSVPCSLHVLRRGTDRPLHPRLGGADDRGRSRNHRHRQRVAAERGAIVERLQQAYPNIVYLRTERETLYGAWNRALEMARGTYFANVNIDDWIRPDTLELFAEALDSFADADLAFSHWAMTNAPRAAPSAETTIRNCMHPPYVPALPLFYCYSGCVQFWRRSTVLSLGGYDPTLSACGDLDILCRLTAYGGSSVLVPIVLQGFYFNPNGLSQASEQSSIEQGIIFLAPGLTRRSSSSIG